MERRKSLRSVVPMALAAMLCLPLGSSLDAKEEALLRLRAFTVNMQRGQAGVLNITIERWSTPEEIQNLKAILIEKNEDALLSALQKIKPRCGYVATNQSLGWDLYAAVERPLPGGVGKKIIMVSDRPMGFWELRQDTRSTDYQFMVAEIRLDKPAKDGGLKGEGKLAEAIKITFNPKTKTIELENYGQEPLRLTDVEVEYPKPKKKS
jgi:hypothetical protein